MAPRTEVANQAPWYRPPMAATPGPKGLLTTARRHACRFDCGVSWVSSERLQAARSARGSSAQR
eukprot:6425239-Lingulodinium_polyedra.AAC.1